MTDLETQITELRERAEKLERRFGDLAAIALGMGAILKAFEKRQSDFMELADRIVSLLEGRMATRKPDAPPSVN